MTRFKLDEVNGKKVTELELDYMIEQAIEASKIPDNHGFGFCTGGDTFVHVFTLYDGTIDIEVTKRQYTITL